MSTEHGRGLRRGLLAGAALIGLAAASGTASADSTVTYLSWSPIVETTTQMIASTEAKHPGIKIDAKIFNYPDYIVDLQTKAASGALPDLIGLEPGARPAVPGLPAAVAGLRRKGLGGQLAGQAVPTGGRAVAPRQREGRPELLRPAGAHPDDQSLVHDPGDAGGGAAAAQDL